MAKPSLPNNLLQEKISANIILAKKYLKAVKFAKQGGAENVRLVIDGSYNTAEICIKSLLLIKLKEIPKTHGGVVQKFGEYYIKNSILPKEAGRLSNRMLRYRNLARYDAQNKEVENVQIGKEAIKFAEQMIKYLEKEITKL